MRRGRIRLLMKRATQLLRSTQAQRTWTRDWWMISYSYSFWKGLGVHPSGAANMSHPGLAAGTEIYYLKEKKRHYRPKKAELGLIGEESIIRKSGEGGRLVLEIVFKDNKGNV